MDTSDTKLETPNFRELFNLKGKLALVTGSARGIGKAAALALAEFGATVILHGVKQSVHLQESLNAVKKISPESFAVCGNLTNPNSPDEICAQIKESSRLPDILVLNASVQFRKKWNEITQEEALAQTQANLISSLKLAQLCAENMKTCKWGRIVTVGSVQEFRPHPDMAMYAATKSAQENMARNLAKQLAPFGITVNNLCPGVFATDRNAEALANPIYAKQVLDAIPTHFCAAPSDAAGAILLLCSDAGRYIVGANIVVDGGLKLP